MAARRRARICLPRDAPRSALEPRRSSCRILPRNPGQAAKILDRATFLETALPSYGLSREISAVVLLYPSCVLLRLVNTPHSIFRQAKFILTEIEEDIKYW